MLTSEIPKPHKIEDSLNDNSSEIVVKGQNGAEPSHENNLLPTLLNEAIDIKSLGEKKRAQETEIFSDHLQSLEKKINSLSFNAAKQECEKTQIEIKQFIEFSSKQVHVPSRDRDESNQNSCNANKNIDETQISFQSNSTENV